MRSEMATTNFFHPDVTRRLQVEGCTVIDAHPQWNSVCPNLILCSKKDGEQFLVGNVLWLQQMCDTYKIPLEVPPEFSWEKVKARLFGKL